MDDMGLATLVVRVQQVGQGGAMPRPDQPSRPPVRLGPGTGAPVQAVLAAAPADLVADGVADATGQVVFALPPGEYWLFIPWEATVPGVPPGTASGGNLPNGRPVLAWAATTLGARACEAVALNLTMALP
jgi:hypothetical protein